MPLGRSRSCCWCWDPAAAEEGWPSGSRRPHDPHHAHGPIYSEGDLVQGGTWQLLLLLVAPVLVDGWQRPGAAVVAVEFRVGKSHGAQGMPALESHHTLLLCGFCQINTAETLGTEKDLSILCGAQVSMKQESNWCMWNTNTLLKIKFFYWHQWTLNIHGTFQMQKMFFIVEKGSLDF